MGFGSDLGAGKSGSPRHPSVLRQFLIPNLNINHSNPVSLIINYMNNLDEINQFNQRCQELMPLIELLKIKHPPNTLKGLERDQMLTIMGFSPDQIEAMTGFKRGQYRFLEGEQSSEEVRLRCYGKEILEKLKALELQCDLEWEQEYDQHLKYGEARGFVEETLT